MSPFSLCLVALSLTAPLTGGCGIDLEYLLPQIFGQATILLGAQPVDDVLRSGRLTEEEAAKLALIREVRNFAGRELGLDTADNYTLFYDAGPGAAAYNVSASHRFEFHAKKWEFPIVGVIPYLGFFDEVAARREFNELAASGYDAFMYEVDAYSTLDFFPNPILSPMLRRSELSLVDTVMHELLHSTVWHPADTTFNESLATFVGRAGALEFLAARYGDDSDPVKGAVEHYEDVDLYNAFIFGLYADLDAYYSNELSREARIAGREARFQAGRDRFAEDYEPLLNDPDAYAWISDLPLNNAWMLANYRYNLDLDLFESVHEATDRDWRQTLAVFRQATAKAAPNAYLREWLAGAQLIGSPQSPRRGRFLGPGAVVPRPLGVPRRGPCPRGRCMVRPANPLDTGGPIW